MSFRVLTGSFRGQKLFLPTVPVRPTKGVVRAAVMNLVRFSLPQSTFLDLYAASGAMGIEALSNGAKEARFVENAPACVEALQKNLQKLGLEESAKIYPMEVAQGIPYLYKERLRFDFIFADPPYEEAGKENLSAQTISLLDRYPLLAPEGSLFVEQSAHTTVHFSLDNLELVKSRKYGKTLLLEFKQSQKTPPSPL